MGCCVKRRWGAWGIFGVVYFYIKVLRDQYLLTHVFPARLPPTVVIHIGFAGRGKQTGVGEFRSPLFPSPSQETAIPKAPGIVTIRPHLNTKSSESSAARQVTVWELFQGLVSGV